MAGVMSKEVISPSLLARIDPNKKTTCTREFSLGMSDWTDSDHDDSGKENREQQHLQVSNILSRPEQWQSQQQATARNTSTAPSMPGFGVLQNCTININYGPSSVNIQHEAPCSYDNFDFPDEVEKELTYI